MIFGLAFLASVLRLFTYQTSHLVSSFNMENDQHIKARLLAWFLAMFENIQKFGFSVLASWPSICPIKKRFEICSNQLSTMINRFLILTKPEKLYFNELLR